MISLPVIQLTKIKAVIFAVIFTVLSVLTPMFFHYIGGPAAGRVFLPMHIFVLTAGLLLGWRTGLAVGLLTPLISFSLTGMPLLAVLPFITIETATYGLFAGLWRESVKNIWLALVGALVIGRLFLLLGIAILPSALTSSYVLNAVKAGWLGILLQMILVPFLVKGITKFLDERT